MKTSCQACKRYWNHVHGKVTRFVRRMSKSSRHCMVIPERFANHFAGKMSRTVKLEGPNGILYDVGVTEHRNRKVLQSGWEVFVDANDIVEKDLLMFRYRGSSRFKVAVFDSSGCEKTVSCFGIGSTMSDQEPITNSTEISGSSSDRNTHSSMGQQSDGCQSGSSGHCRKLAWTDAASSPSEDFPGEDSPYEHESSGSDDHTLPKMISTARVKEEQSSDASGRSDGCQSGSSSHSGGTRKIAVISTPSSESEYDSFDSGDIPGPPKDKYVLSSRSCLADAQKEKIDMLLQDVQSRTLAFVAIMRKSNVQPLYPSLIIAKKYAVAHFPHESASVILQRPGESKKWHPRFYKGKGGSIHKIRGEWFDFVCDNCVEEGDICIFVPAKGGGRFTFTVHLLPKESNAHEGPFVPPYIISQTSCLSSLQLSIVKDKVQAIQLEAPLYVTVMNKTNAGVNGNYMLEFGAKYATVYLPKAEQTILLQHRRKIWHTNMRIWDGRRRVLDGGWRKFVSDNHLRVGDMCMFELKKNRKKLTMIVHIISRDQC